MNPNDNSIYDFSKVKISPFKYNGNEPKWVVTINDKKFIVSESFKLTIEKLKNSNTINSDISCLSNIEITALNKLFNSDYKNFNSKKSGLWYKFRILNPNSLEKFKFLGILHNRRAYLLFMIISILFNITMFLCYFEKISLMKNFSLLKTNSIDITLFIVLSLLGVLFHELGHVSASLKYKIIPKELGIGMYFIYPVAYVDVTNTWNLPRLQRLSIDIGGVYFQFIYTSLILLLWVFIKNNIFIYLYILLLTSILFNLNPFLKYDGYWILSDVLGVYNLNSRIPKFFSCIILYALGKKENYNNLKNMWNKKIIFSLFIYSLITLIFYFIFIYSIISILFNMLINIKFNFSLLNLFIIILFSFFAIKSIIALFKMILSIKNI